MEKTEIQKLIELIKEQNNAYRAGIPLVSDKEYDKNIEKLYKLDPTNEWFNGIEPAQVKDSRKVKLPVPMKSLNKVKTSEDLSQWLKSVGISGEDTVVVMPKFDGLSLLYNEYNGRAYSRGGSENEGQDCTVHCKAAGIKSIKGSLSFTYGEFVFNKFSWRTNFEGRTSPYTGDKYKSPRNTAAGLLNRDVPAEELKYVDFFRYGADEKSIYQFETFAKLISFICTKYDQEHLYLEEKSGNLNKETLKDLFDKWSETYYIDGLVIYVNDLSKWKQLGRQETTGNPNYAIAYKDPEFTDTFITTVNNVSWSISKSGAFKPVVNIETVDTGDCEMENPTGYNAKYIFDNKIGPNAVIKVTRSGGVIPKILQVIEPASNTVMEDMKNELKVCHICGKTTSFNETGVELCCTNHDCEGIRLAKIIFFYNTIGAENMGAELISKIFHAGYNTLFDILEITFDELLDIEGIGEGIANAVLTNNKKAHSGIDVFTLMHASDCFQGIGQVKAKKILEDMCPENMFDFINGTMDTSMSEESKAKLTKTQLSFVDGTPKFYKFVSENHLTILPPKKAAQVTNDKYSGFKVCFTGIRDAQLEADIISGSGEIMQTVSKKTTHLIVLDKNKASSKLEKAKKFGTEILTIEEFKEI